MSNSVIIIKNVDSINTQLFEFNKIKSYIIKSMNISWVYEFISFLNEDLFQNKFKNLRKRTFINKIVKKHHVEISKTQKSWNI